MLRLTGAVLVLFGTAGYSVCFCKDLRQRILYLREMRRMYELFSSQIGCFMASFPEACKIVAERVEMPFAEMLRRVYGAMEENTGRPLPQIWEEEAVLCTRACVLKKEDKALLEGFARSLGYADGRLQRHAIEQQLSALTERIEALETRRAGSERMAMSFGIMGGLLLVIILI